LKASTTTFQFAGKYPDERGGYQPQIRFDVPHTQMWQQRRLQGDQ
jgi:hypothetical protein